MDEPRELWANRHWRNAVWALRAAFVGLGVGLSGLVAMLSGFTPWVLAAGVIVWLVVGTFTSVEFFRARGQLPEPRPGYWSMRFQLIHDTFHVRSSSSTERIRPT
jgi:hypothetical protein